MSTMTKLDMICLRRGVLKSTALTAAFVSMVICIGMGSVNVIIPCITCCMAVTLLYNLLAFDEQNDWQRLRLTLPLSRDQVIKGRYMTCLAIAGVALAEGVALTLLCLVAAFLLQGSAAGDFAQSVLLSAEPLELTVSAIAGVAITIVMMALTIPIAAKTGLTKAIRTLPIVFALLLIMFIGVGAVGKDLTPRPDFLLWLQTDMGVFVLVLALLAVACAAYVGSCALARRFYSGREL
jgi:ABC-2 type transport system permease protein